MLVQQRLKFHRITSFYYFDAHIINNHNQYSYVPCYGVEKCEYHKYDLHVRHIAGIWDKSSRRLAFINIDGRLFDKCLNIVTEIRSDNLNARSDDIEYSFEMNEQTATLTGVYSPLESHHRDAAFNLKKMRQLENSSSRIEISNPIKLEITNPHLSSLLTFDGYSFLHPIQIYRISEDGKFFYCPFRQWESARQGWNLKSSVCLEMLGESEEDVWRILRKEFPDMKATFNTSSGKHFRMPKTRKICKACSGR